MRLRHAIPALAAVGFVAFALVGQPEPATAPKMTAAAKAFLAALTPEQQKTANLPFDSKARLAWFFTPQQDNAIIADIQARVDSYWDKVVQG